jgi:hypothetical protein
VKNIKKIICILFCIFFGCVAPVSAGLFSLRSRRGNNHGPKTLCPFWAEKDGEEAILSFILPGRKNIQAALYEDGELIISPCEFKELQSVFNKVAEFDYSGSVKKIDLSTCFEEEKLPEEIYFFANLETLILNKKTRFPSIYRFKELQLFEYRNKRGFPSYPKNKKFVVVNGVVFVEVRIYPIKMERVVDGGVDCVKVHTNRGFFIRIPLEGALDDIESIHVSIDTGVPLEFSRDCLVIDVSEDNIVEDLFLIYRSLGVTLKPPLFKRTRDVSADTTQQTS